MGWPKLPTLGDVGRAVFNNPVANAVKDTVVDVVRDVKHGTEAVGDALIDGGRELASNTRDMWDSGFEVARDVVNDTRNAWDAGFEVARDVVNDTRNAWDLGFEVARVAVNDTRNAWDLGFEVARDAWNVGVEGAKGLVEGIAGIATDPAGAAERALLSQVQQLNSEGDSLTLGLEFGVSVLGGKGEVGGEIKVRMEDGKYVVSAGIGVGAGVDATAAKLPAAAKAGAEALGNLGGELEYSFDTPEEAARAARIIAMQAGATGMFGVAGAVIALPSVLGSAREDAQFLGDHLSGMSLKAGISAEAEASIGFKSLFGAGIGGEFDVTSSVKFEFERDENGNISKTYLVTSSEISAGIEGELNIFSPKKSPDLGAFSLHGGASVNIRAEQRMELASVSEFMNDPQGALRKMGESAEVSLTASVEGELGASVFSGALADLSGGVNIELKLSGKPSEIFNREALLALSRGEFGNAASLMGDNINAGLTVSDVVALGVDFDEGIELSGTGINVAVKGQRKDYTTRFETNSTLSEVISELSNLVQS